MSKRDVETFYSLASLADAAEKYGRETVEDLDNGRISAKAGDVTWTEALELGRKGWTDQLEPAMDVAESAITLAEKEHLTDTFQPVWDVTGGAVDVARYLSGEPECMIDFPLTRTSNVGRVITLCASVAYSWSVTADVITKRGQCIVGLALALSRLGHAVELWADVSSDNHENHIHTTRTLVKGVNDELDPATVMFAYAHPAMLRALEWAAREKWGTKYSPRHTAPAPPERDLPEGTIYLPELLSAVNVPDADTFLQKYLGELGLLAE